MCNIECPWNACKILLHWNGNLQCVILNVRVKFCCIEMVFSSVILLHWNGILQCNFVTLKWYSPDYIHIFPCVLIFIIPCENRVKMSLLTKLFLRYLLHLEPKRVNQQNILWRTQMSSCVAELTFITFKIIPHNVHDNCIC